MSDGCKVAPAAFGAAGVAAAAGDALASSRISGDVTGRRTSIVSVAARVADALRVGLGSLVDAAGLGLVGGQRFVVPLAVCRCRFRGAERLPLPPALLLLQPFLFGFCCSPGTVPVPANGALCAW